MTHMVDDWGTARERARVRRRWKWVGIALALVAVAPVAATFGLGLVEGLASVRNPSGVVHTRDHAPWLGVAIMMVAAVAVQWHLWRGSDEVQRRAVADALALAGIVAFVALPVLSLAQKPLGLASPAMLGWGLAIATLVGARIVQRLRG